MRGRIRANHPSLADSVRLSGMPALSHNYGLSPVDFGLTQAVHYLMGKAVRGHDCEAKAWVGVLRKEE